MIEVILIDDVVQCAKKKKIKSSTNKLFCFILKIRMACDILLSYVLSIAIIYLFRLLTGSKSLRFGKPKTPKHRWQ